MCPHEMFMDIEFEHLLVEILRKDLRKKSDPEIESEWVRQICQQKNELR